MDKIAAKIANIVLEKLSVSPRLAQRVLTQHTQPLLQGGLPDDVAAVAMRAIAKTYPRTTALAGAGPSKMSPIQSLQNVWNQRIPLTSRETIRQRAANQPPMDMAKIKERLLGMRETVQG